MEVAVLQRHKAASVSGAADAMVGKLQFCNGGKSPQVHEKEG
jgi:hypothetical protein